MGESRLGQSQARLGNVQLGALGGGGSAIPAGSLTLAGLAPSLVQTLNVTTTVPDGALTLAGLAPTLAFASTGQVTVPVPAGSLTITGHQPSLQVGPVIVVPPGVLEFGFFNIQKIPNQQSGGRPPALAFTIPVTTRALALTGQEPDAAPGIRQPPPAVLALQGQTPNVLVGVLAVPAGTLTFTGQTPALVTAIVRVPPVGGLVLAGFVPTVAIPQGPAPGAGTVVLGGLEPGVGHGSAPPAGTLALAGLTPTSDATGVFVIPPAALVFAGLSPDLPTRTPGPGALTLQGHAPSTGVPPGQLVLQGLAPSLVAPIITIPTGQLVLQGHAEPIRVGAPLVVTEHLVRRQRDVPYLTDEQAWLFFHEVELHFEKGVGLEAGQGVDPQVMVQWSDDNARTWSHEHWRSAGKMGRYRQRAIWRRLGRSRKRILRFVVTDPVKWALIDAFVNGTSER